MTVPIDLSGHHAVVTGAGKGIGRAIALELAAAGAGIFAVSRTEADLKRLGVDGEALGKPYGYGVVDLRGKAGADCIAAAALVSLGQVDILVNNAGVSDNAPVLEVSEAQWDATMHINARGAFFLAQVLGRHMVKQGWGRTQPVVPGRHRGAGGARRLRRQQGGPGPHHPGAGPGVGPVRRHRELGGPYRHPDGSAKKWGRLQICGGDGIN